MEGADVPTSGVALPPRVEGERRGWLLLRAALEPSGALPPGRLAARVRWWGDQGDGALLHLLSRERAAAGDAVPPLPLLRWPLRTGPRHLARYLRDAGALQLVVLDVEAADAAAAAGGSPAPPLGVVTVGLAGLAVGAPLRGTFPVLAPAPSEGHEQQQQQQSRVLGSLCVTLELDYGSLRAPSAPTPSEQPAAPLHPLPPAETSASSVGTQGAAAPPPDPLPDDGMDVWAQIRAALER